jgi:hypothetical protein
MTAPTLGELVDQHHQLEQALADAMAHPATSDAEIAAIKRKKLKLKDEIAVHERGRSLAA